MIDTSTTAGKIEVMQAFEDGRLIEFNDGACWCEMLSNQNPAWHWVQCRYRIKPQTVEEAAGKAFESETTYTTASKGDFILGARWGAKWQKEQTDE